MKVCNPDDKFFDEPRSELFAEGLTSTTKNNAMYIHTTQETALSERKKKRIQRKIEKSLTTLDATAANYKLHLEIGDLYTLIQDYGNAESQYMASLDLLRREPLTERGRKQIIMIYGKILSFAPNQREAHRELANEYVAAGQKEKAFRFLLSSGKQAYEDSDYELALQCYQQVIELGKSNPHILERCTDIYLKLGRKEDAAKHYTQIGDLYAREEKHIEALEYYKKASAIAPEDAELFLKIARVYYALEWTENAATELAKLGKFHEQRQSYADAIKYYQNSLRLDPENEKAQQGRLRVEQVHPASGTNGTYSNTQAQNILEELDKLETPVSAEKEHTVEEPATWSPPDRQTDDSRKADLQEEKTLPLIDLRDAMNWDEHIMDLSEKDDFMLAAGLDDQAQDAPDSPAEIVAPVEFKTDIQFLSEDTLQALPEAAPPDLPQEKQTPEPPAQVAAALPVEAEPAQQTMEDASSIPIQNLQEKLEELERQLHNTEEEKYFLQEQFTAQIRTLKKQENSIQREFEHTIEDVTKDKDILQQRLEQINSTYEASRQNAEQFDEARYEALVAKIQQRKTFLQEHVNTLLKQREENGRFLSDELKNLDATKQRLQGNIAYIQQVKSQLEHKISHDLNNAQQRIRELTADSETLHRQLHSQEQIEQSLREKFEKLNREKETLQEEQMETISALTAENEQLEQQLQQLDASKTKTERTLKKKFQTLHQSHRQLQNEYKTTLASKEAELSETAQRLTEFADKYVKLEHTLGAIRTERDKLDKLLVRETATREVLQKRLFGIEEQVNDLEAEGTQLLEQFGEELDRQFGLKQHVSDEFQVSLDELEQLLSRQEEEIHALEVI